MDRCISVATFFSNCTLIEAENTVKETEVSLKARGSATSGVDGRAGVVTRWVELPARDPNKEEKNPPLDCLIVFVGRMARLFSVPDVYTHFIT